MTEHEFEIVKKHTQLGSQQIGNALQVLSTARTIAAQHHEKWNGNGYIGLSGDDIHPYARIVAVADVYDALISMRPYKAPMAANEVIRYFENHAGTLFDAGMVSILLEHADEISGLYR